MSNKLREALKKCARRLKDTIPYLPIETFRKYVFTDIREAEDALAEPLRNCDIGTVDEQITRFYDYCYKKCNGSNCGCREYVGDVIDKCAIKWAQMPYENKEE